MPVYKERAAGIYRSTYKGCTDTTFTDQDTGEVQDRWRWTFQEIADPATTGEMSKITPRSMKSPNSNAYKMATGILGHKPNPGDDTETHVGQVYDVVYGPNQAGNLTITSVVRVNDAPVAQAAAVPLAPQPAAALPELP